MANQRGTFLKRQREQNLKDKARDKAARLAARRAEARAARDASGGSGGPPIEAMASDAPVDESPPETSDEQPTGRDETRRAG